MKDHTAYFTFRNFGSLPRGKLLFVLMSRAQPFSVPM